MCIFISMLFECFILFFDSKSDFSIEIQIMQNENKIVSVFIFRFNLICTSFVNQKSMYDRIVITKYTDCKQKEKEKFQKKKNEIKKQNFLSNDSHNQNFLWIIPSIDTKLIRNCWYYFDLNQITILKPINQIHYIYY